ncbi:MAG TPA: hypothetical protein IAC82_07275 [Candidatus Merdivicinus intestinigallinarum]|nr:hypothetical protein [Candidatus Merdivicinus intestinigallinarum]
MNKFTTNRGVEGQRPHRFPQKAKSPKDKKRRKKFEKCHFPFYKTAGFVKRRKPSDRIQSVLWPTIQ